MIGSGAQNYFYLEVTTSINCPMIITPQKHHIIVRKNDYFIF